MKRQAFNPYLPENEYVPDGEPHVFGDRVYVYGSHDRFGAGMFCVNDYVCWSAPVSDLTDWRLEGTIYRKRQDPANPLGLHLLFAPDVCQGADGHYYLYYAFDFLGQIGVAVCDEPAGSYEFLGHVSWPDGKPYGRAAGDGFPFDPAVLVDDDGRVYLYSGFYNRMPALLTGFHSCAYDGGYMVKLDPADMLTIKGKQHLLFPKEGPGSFSGHEFFEASSIRKYDGVYVFSYSSRLNHELCYATSDRPDGDFSYGGTLVSIGDVGLPGHPDEAHATNYLGNTHGGMLRLPEDKGGWRYYTFYHRQTDRTSYSRQACAERLEGTPQTGFAQAEVTSCGLNDGPLEGRGSYQARIACNLWSGSGVGRVDAPFHRLRLSSHPCFTQEGRDNDPNARQFISNMRDGAVAGYKYFDLSDTTRLDVMARCSGGGRLEVATDEAFSNVLGTIGLDGTGRDWSEFGTNLSPVGEGAEASALFLRYRGPGRADLLELRLS